MPAPLFGYQEAYALWDGNTRAKQGIQEATLGLCRPSFKERRLRSGSQAAWTLKTPSMRRCWHKIGRPAGARSAVAAAEDGPPRRGRFARDRAGRDHRCIYPGQQPAKHRRDRQERRPAQKKEAEHQAIIATKNEEKANLAKADALTQTKEAERQAIIATQNEKTANLAKADALTQKKEAQRQAIIATKNEEKANVPKPTPWRGRKRPTTSVNSPKPRRRSPNKTRKRPTRPRKRRSTAAISPASASPRPRSRITPSIVRDALGRTSARLAQLGVGKADLPWHSRQPHDRRGRAHRGPGHRSGRRAAGQRRLGWNRAGMGLGYRQEAVQLPTGGNYVFALAFSPDGRHLAAGTNARPDYIQVWNSRTGQLEKSFAVIVTRY